jgi:hypothetical protein
MLQVQQHQLLLSITRRRKRRGSGVDCPQIWQLLHSLLLRRSSSCWLLLLLQQL